MHGQILWVNTRQVNKIQNQDGINSRDNKALNGKGDIITGFYVANLAIIFI